MSKILITGAAKRVGAELARACAADAHTVVLHYNQNKAAAEALAGELRKTGALIELVHADLSDSASVSTMMAAASKTGPVTALINNASLFDYDDSKTVSAEKITQHMAVNLIAPTLLIKDMAERVPQGVTGCVINMLDAKLFGMNPDYYSYTLSKSALHTLTIMAAQAYAPRLRVNAIAPGILLPSGGQSEAEFQASHKRNLLGQGAEIPEVVATMRLLLSAKSITGEVIVLDGGAHLHPAARDVAFLKD